MTPDPKWLDLLKASGWKTGAVAIGCAALVLAIKGGFLSAGPNWVLGFAAGAVICACLAVSSLVSGLFKLLKPIEWLMRVQQHRAFKKSVRDYIPRMTEGERAIIAYLLHHNEMMFTAASDGGHAATLISRGIVLRALRPGQMFAPEDMPCAVHDLAWPILETHRDQFPYQEAETHPWRVHWMAR
jgi:hypothetical protein